MSSVYVVPADVLASFPPLSEWHATGIPADPTLCLVAVKWANPNAQLAFESVAGVVFVGDPWDQVSPDVATLLASLDDSAVSTAGGVATIPSSDVPPAPETVARALRKVSWPGVRMLG